MRDIIIKIGMQLIQDPKIRANILAATGQGVQAVIGVITPYILPILSSLGGVALTVAPFAIPVLIGGIAVWAIAELEE